jgi:hypothetical protein
LKNHACRVAAGDGARVITGGERVRFAIVWLAAWSHMIPKKHAHKEELRV